MTDTDQIPLYLGVPLALLCLAAAALVVTMIAAVIITIVKDD